MEIYPFTAVKGERSWCEAMEINSDFASSRRFSSSLDFFSSSASSAIFSRFSISLATERIKRYPKITAKIKREPLKIKSAGFCDTARREKRTTETSIAKISFCNHNQIKKNSHNCCDKRSEYNI